MQATQAPALHTLLVPQLVPVATGVVVAAHPTAGEHVTLPVTHGFSGTQSSPAEHETHTPALQIWLLPQVLPLSTLPLSMQTGAPVSQAVVPVRHGLPPTAQLLPTLQVTHAPAALHTRLVPQEVPAVSWILLSSQVGSAPLQDSVPS